MYENTGPSFGDEIGDSLRKWNQATSAFYSDPLAGLTFVLRLQTHNGNNVPLGLFKDTACTDPATEDGDMVAGWKDTFGSLAAVQATEEKRPLLFFVDGVPTLWFDGVDDNFSSDTVTAAQVSLFTATQQDSVASKQILIQWGATGADNECQLHHWVNGSGNLSCFYRDSSPAFMETSFGSVNDTNWHVFSSTFTALPQCWVDGGAGVATSSTGTLNQSTSKLGIGAKVNAAGLDVEATYWNGSMTAVLVATSAFSAGDRQLVEGYLAEIHP